MSNTFTVLERNIILTLHVCFHSSMLSYIQNIHKQLIFWLELESKLGILLTLVDQIILSQKFLIVTE